MVFDKPQASNDPTPTPWLHDAVAEAYGKKPETASSRHESGSSLLDFAGNHWQELAGLGVLLGTGIAIVASDRLGPLAGLLRGGESALAERETAGISAETLGRLRNVDHFVFDMDRTLVDHDTAFAALRGSLTDGLVQQTGLSRDFISNALDETTQRLNSPYFWNRLDEIQPLQEKFPGVDLNARFGSVSRDAHDAYYAALKAKPETVQLLQFLREQGKGVHVFTASSPARALEKLTGSGLIDHVDNIYASGVNAFEDTPASGMLIRETSSHPVVTLAADAKPTATGYQTIMDHLQSPPERLAMTGDHPIDDVAKSQAQGYFGTHAAWYNNPPLEGVRPDLQISQPSQMTSILKKAYRS